MNRIWYISPSNQRANMGVGEYGSEKEQMELLAAAIAPHLDRAGVSFHIGDPNMKIEERAKDSNEMKAKFHLALHSNAGGKGVARGPVAYYYSDAGKAFGEILTSQLLALGQKTNRCEHVKQNKDFYELRKTKAPACLLEVDFHDSPDGAAYIMNHRDRIAEAIAKVIIQADGKAFAEETAAECMSLCRSWGLFDLPDGSKRWKEPLTREEAAILALRLKKLMERG